MIKINPAKTLIRDFIELNTLSRDYKAWTHEKLNLNPPRYYRLLRMEACLRALGISFKSWDHFSKGVLIYDAKHENLQKRIFEKVKENVQEKYKEIFETMSYLEFDCEYYFFMFLSMRKSFFEFNTLQSCVLSTSDSYCMPLILLDDIIVGFEDYIHHLEILLAYFLNPEMTEIPLDLMVSEFGFPNVDLEKIDWEWY